ncbi:MAG TPA: hypothetical protein VMR45_03680 [Patescibacteria group bacterium]|nr:hypothetical protein [Patescibacteria group bacterium]
MDLLYGMDRAAAALFPPTNLRGYYEEDSGGFALEENSVPPCVIGQTTALLPDSHQPRYAFDIFRSFGSNGVYANGPAQAVGSLLFSARIGIYYATILYNIDTTLGPPDTCLSYNLRVEHDLFIIHTTSSMALSQAATLPDSYANIPHNTTPPEETTALDSPKQSDMNELTIFINSAANQINSRA